MGLDFREGISRRRFLGGAMAGICFSILQSIPWLSKASAAPPNPLFWIKKIPLQPFDEMGSGNHHLGIDYLLQLMGSNGLKFYRSASETELGGPSGLMGVDDGVLIKVNAQWKYRGCTNRDLLRGLIQSLPDHPDGFAGEVVIIENGQSQGSLNGDSLGWGSYPDNRVHANANDESQLSVNRASFMEQGG